MASILAAHDGASRPLEEAERKSAALVVCEYARDAEDARLLLMVLGLVESPPPGDPALRDTLGRTYSPESRLSHLQRRRAQRRREAGR